MAEIVAVCLGERRGRGKSPVGKAFLKKGWGMVGDAHAGPGRRQVALLEWERVRRFNEEGAEAGPGDFAENIDLKGIDFSRLKAGTVLEVGPARLKITEKGKPEWKEGDYSYRGTALTAKHGLFARVVRSGEIKKGDKVTIIGGD